jgi:hypothetical protein
MFGQFLLNKNKIATVLYSNSGCPKFGNWPSICRPVRLCQGNRGRGKAVAGGDRFAWWACTYASDTYLETTVPSHVKGRRELYLSVCNVTLERRWPRTCVFFQIPLNRWSDSWSYSMAVFSSKFWSAKIYCSISFIFGNNCSTIE